MIIKQHLDNLINLYRCYSPFSLMIIISFLLGITVFVLHYFSDYLATIYVVDREIAKIIILIMVFAYIVLIPLHVAIFFQWVNTFSRKKEDDALNQILPRIFKLFSLMVVATLVMLLDLIYKIFRFNMTSNEMLLVYSINSVLIFIVIIIISVFANLSLFKHCLLEY
jgi:uncharacterized membrane protein